MKKCFFWNAYPLLVLQAYFFRADSKLVIPSAVGQKTQRRLTGAYRGFLLKTNNGKEKMVVELKFNNYIL